MILNSDNEIDNKISMTFSKEVIENINSQSADYFGINIGIDTEKDFAFKIYYRNAHGNDKSSDFPLINWLYEKDVVRFVTIAPDSDNNKHKRCYIGLSSNRNNDNMNALFDGLENNVCFFKKYKKEILDFSKMKNRLDEGFDYASLYFLGCIADENNEIKTLKCYWYNKILEGYEDLFCDKYYLEYLKNCTIPEFQKLLPYAEAAIKNCDVHMIMEGIDYNENYSQKHKIYFQFFNNTYDGLIKTFDNEAIKEKLEKIRIWSKIHGEFKCAGFAIGKTHNSPLTLNIYFSIDDTTEE